MEENKLPPIEEMTRIVHHLQRVLRIQDWDIDVEYVDQYKIEHIMHETDVVACCGRNRHRKEATISINVDHPEIKDGWYEAIAHELYHIVTGELYDLADDLIYELNSPQITRAQLTRTDELVVNTLAKTFVRIYPLEFVKEEGSDAWQK